VASTEASKQCLLARTAAEHSCVTSLSASELCALAKRFQLLHCSNELGQETSMNELIQSSDKTLQTSLGAIQIASGEMTPPPTSPAPPPTNSTPSTPASTSSTTPASTSSTTPASTSSTTPASSCGSTTGGDAEGAACSFPFTHDGQQYTSCTYAGHGEPWCKTAAGTWGECSTECAAGVDAPKWDDGHPCTQALPSTATQLDYCHCKWKCESLNSWKRADGSNANVVDGWVQGVNHGDVENCPTSGAQSDRRRRGTTSYCDRKNKIDDWAQVVNNAKESWVTEACDRACGGDGAGQLAPEVQDNQIHSRTIRVGLEEKVTGSTAMWKNIPIGFGDQSADWLPGTSYVIAKSVAETRTRLVKGDAVGNGNIAMAEFEIKMHSLKALQCITTDQNLKRCCAVPRFDLGQGGIKTGPGWVNGEPIASNWNAQFDSRAEGAYGPYATAQKYIHLKNPSIGAHTANCYSEGVCWSSNDPPVSCSVKKTTMVFRICMTKRTQCPSTQCSGGSGGADLLDLTTPICWYPTNDPTPPKPFSNDGTVDWTDGGTGCSGQSKSSLWKCYYSCGNSAFQFGECERNKFRKQATWSSIVGLAM